MVNENILPQTASAMVGSTLAAITDRIVTVTSGSLPAGADSYYYNEALHMVLHEVQSDLGFGSQRAHSADAQWPVIRVAAERVRCRDARRGSVGQR